MTKANAAILREADFPKISRVGGATTTQLVTPTCGARAFLSGFTDIPPGGAIPLHYHNCEEAVLVVSGRATVEVDGDTFPASAGDVVWQPADIPHRFINPSETETLRIYWTYASVDATRTLVDTGETGPILAEHR
ncbi:MAG: cupin domain-containing protein [Pseudomonadota bacterium]